jgi:large subunit ribosomal protein L21
MSLGIIATGGKQYLVSPGDKIQVEKLAGAVGDTVKFEQVLGIFNGKSVEVGKPFVAGKAIEGKILAQGRGDKIHVLKYKSKSKYRRKIGHRQAYTEIEITNV